jgi:hypothetical protein
VLIIDRRCLRCIPTHQNVICLDVQIGSMHQPGTQLVKTQPATSHIGAINQGEQLALLSLAVLSPELLDLDLDFLADTGSELRSVSKLEENFKPHKHGG